MNVLSSYVSELRSRKVNEDCVVVDTDPQECRIAVADGLGGHMYGDVASRLTCRTAVEAMKKMESENEPDFRNVYETCRTVLLEEQEKRNAGMNMLTTLNLVLIRNGMLYRNHIGDTRTYLFEQGKIISVTRDDSVPMMLCDLGEITKDEIRHHPDRSRLVQVLGIPAEQVAWTPEEPLPLHPGMAVLVCTDGFWEDVLEEEMETCLQNSQTPKQWLEAMLEILHERGVDHKQDNATAAAVMITRTEEREATS